MGGYRVYVKVTVKFIAKKTGRCEETVRRHIREDKLDPWDWDAVVGWIEENKKVDTEIN